MAKSVCEIAEEVFNRRVLSWLRSWRIEEILEDLKKKEEHEERIAKGERGKGYPPINPNFYDSLKELGELAEATNEICKCQK